MHQKMQMKPFMIKNSSVTKTLSGKEAKSAVRKND